MNRMGAVFLKIPLDPKPKGRPRFSRQGHAYTPADTRKHERELSDFMRSLFTQKPFDIPISVTMRFTIQRPKTVKREHPCVKPDLDNIQKLCNDAANGILWEDDALICEMNSEKRYGEKGLIEISIYPMDSGVADDTLDG